MVNITRWDPFRELTDFREVFDHGLSRPWRLLSWDGEDGMFPVDISETDDEVAVSASMPGVKPKDVQISVIGDTLTIKGETKEEHEEKAPNYYRKERHVGAFRRALSLPARVDADQAEATFEDGVLTLRMPKASEVRPKTIEVKAKAS